MKAVVNDVKSGKSFQKEIEKDKETQLYGKRIGQTVDGGVLGLPGYALKLTGGSDAEGFPMRAEIRAARARALLGSGPGVRNLQKGEKRKKTVAGNTVSTKTAQLNLKIETYGDKGLADLGIAFKEKTPEERKAAKEAKAAKKGKGAKK